MIIVINRDAKKEEILKLQSKIESLNCKARFVKGDDKDIMGIVGDTTRIDPDKLRANEFVENVCKIQEPFKLANRSFHPQDSIIKINDNLSIGGAKIAIIGGPCSVESEEQIVEIAKSVKESGAGFLRGGAFKPRTSPYSFQGLELEGLELLKKARKETGLPIVTEIMSADMLDVFERDVDIIQVGARNMQNFDLLKQLGKTKKPILLKRGLSATIEELIMSAEYIMAGGNENVIFCERGIRTFETYTRNTLDLSAIPAIKRLSHLPVVVDPSHSAGMWWMVEPLSKAAVAVGADGLIIEVHNDPANAKCDGQQSVKPEKFKSLVEDLDKIAKVTGRSIF